MKTTLSIIIMLLYCLGGGLNLGLAVAYYKERKYIAFGISAMYAFSMLLLMAERVFRVGGI